MYKRKARILFLCTGNSGRSQIAQAYANAIGADWLEARSANREAQDVNPRAVAVMREVGVDITGQAPNRISDELLAWADLVVTVGVQAEALCPTLPPGVQKKHWPLPDPIPASGSEARIMAAYRDVRDDVRARVEGLIGGMRLLAKMDADDDRED